MSLYSCFSPLMYSKSALSRKEVKLRREKTPAAAPSEDDDQRHKRFEEDLERMQRLGEEIPGGLDDTRDSRLVGTMCEGHKPQQASGAMLRALKLLLEEKDKQQTWGGLKRILTKEGHHLWPCPHHLAERKL